MKSKSCNRFMVYFHSLRFDLCLNTQTHTLARTRMLCLQVCAVAVDFTASLMWRVMFGCASFDRFAFACTVRSMICDSLDNFFSPRNWSLLKCGNENEQLNEEKREQKTVHEFLIGMYAYAYAVISCVSCIYCIILTRTGSLARSRVHEFRFNKCTTVKENRIQVLKMS